MKVVYASTSAVVGQSRIIAGTHWPADDPLVLANPTLFSDDPRWGLAYSVEPADLREPFVPEKRAYVRRT